MDDKVGDDSLVLKQIPVPQGPECGPASTYYN